MTDREKMEALLDGETLFWRDIQAKIGDSGRVLLQDASVNYRDKGRLLASDEWQIKPKKITLTREDLRAAYNQALWPYRPNLKDHESENFKEVCQNLGL